MRSAIALITVPLMTVGLLAGADWPIFRGEPRQTAFVKDPLPAKLTELWTFKTKSSVEGGAVIVANVVYVGSTDGHVYALDLTTGQQKWKAPTGPIKAPLGFHDGRVYAGNDEGLFHCLEAATGKEIWKHNTEAEITSAPAFSGSDVLFGGADEHLYCLSRADGTLRWKFQVAGGPVQGTPVIADGKTYAAGCDSQLHSLNLESGKEISSVELGGQVGASAAVAGERLYIGTMTNQLVAVDLATMKIAWSMHARQPFYASVAVTDKLVIAGNRDRKIYAVDRNSGEEVWQFITAGRIDSSPVVAGNRVYVGSFDNSLYVLDVANGKEIQKLPLDGSIIASPAVSNGRLVIGTNKGTVYCFGAK